MVQAECFRQDIHPRYLSFQRTPHNRATSDPNGTSVFSRLRSGPRSRVSRQNQDNKVDLDLDELAFDSSDGKERQITWTGGREQEWIDRIVHGQEAGHYFVLPGPKVNVLMYRFYKLLVNI